MKVNFDEVDQLILNAKIDDSLALPDGSMSPTNGDGVRFGSRLAHRENNRKKINCTVNTDGRILYESKTSMNHY